MLRHSPDRGRRGRLQRQHLAAGAIYGTIVYLTILVLLEEDRTGAVDAAAILVGTGLVFWLAHVYAHLVPIIAGEGRLPRGTFRRMAADQSGILAAVAIPLIPLFLAMIGLIDDRAALRGAVITCLVLLAVIAVWEARSGGLGWGRSLAVSSVLLAAGIGLLWLEVSLH